MNHCSVAITQSQTSEVFCCRCVCCLCFENVCCKKQSIGILCKEVGFCGSTMWYLNRQNIKRWTSCFEFSSPCRGSYPITGAWLSQYIVVYVCCGLHWAEAGCDLDHCTLCVHLSRTENQRQLPVKCVFWGMDDFVYCTSSIGISPSVVWQASTKPSGDTKE